MRIISKYKDFWDWQVSIWGMDENVVYDRRDIWNGWSECWLFTRPYMYYEDTRQLESIIYYIVVECGNRQWLFKYSLYEKPRQAELKLVGQRVAEKKLLEYTVNCGVSSRHYTYKNRFWINHNCYSEDTINIIDKDEWRDISEFSYNNKPGEVLLRDSPFVPYLDPSEVWIGVYEYLSSLKDKKFEDSRTDVQKLESAGFDKKTSFRNVK